MVPNTFSRASAELTFEHNTGRGLLVRVTDVYGIFQYRETPPATIRAGRGHIIWPE